MSVNLGLKKAKGQVTALDVANELGVSISTVSRTFTPGASVSAKMEEKVLAAAKKLGYRPNVLARSLMTRKTGLIGILIKDFDNPAYLKIIDELTLAIQLRGLQALVINMAHTAGIRESVDMIMQYQVDGLVETSGSSIDPKLAEECQRVNTPLIQFGYNSKKIQTSAVCCDDFAGGMQAAELFYKMGYKNLAYIASDRGDPSMERRDGFLSVVDQKMGNKHVPIEFAGDWTYKGGVDAASQLLTTHSPPDAIFCADDIIAMGVMDAARSKFGLRIPEDLGVVGFDDIHLSDSYAYSLTTIQQPYNQMIEAALDLMNRMIEDPSRPSEVQLFSGKLVIRESHNRTRT